MQVILNVEEGWSTMTLMVSQVLDGVELSPEGRKSVKNWRTDRTVGTSEMDELTIGLNEALGTVLDEKTTRRIRRKGYYVSSKEAER
jgi:hypothetical protein